MHVISSGGIPLALALGVRGYRLRRPWFVFAGFAVADVAALARLHARAAARLPARRARADRGGRLAAPRAPARSTAGWRSPRSRARSLFIAARALLSRPYLRVADEHPEATRSAGRGRELLRGRRGCSWSRRTRTSVWGGATAGIRDELENVPEKTLFPGLVIVALAIAGLWSARYPRRLRLALGAGVVVVSVLALGFQEEGGLL